MDIDNHNHAVQTLTLVSVLGIRFGQSVGQVEVRNGGGISEAGLSLDQA